MIFLSFHLREQQARDMIHSTYSDIFLHVSQQDIWTRFIVFIDTEYIFLRKKKTLDKF